jgi:uncharacterized protein YcnI
MSQATSALGLLALAALATGDHAAALELANACYRGASRIGAERWIEIPAEGQDAHDLESPAPGGKIVEPGHEH